MKVLRLWVRRTVVAHIVRGMLLMLLAAVALGACGKA